VPEQPDYHSYLIRLYRQKNDPVAWRVSLENVQTGERRGFATLQGLYEFLNRVTRGAQEVPERNASGGEITEDY
jgi:hypothetical protein